ncbi:hypothetical protein BDR07DRAFT_1481469 [Suillus spraguei]|nr:hypothetical protein BDR07DRAFT_1481469 [Suillus spraguei]
MTSKYSECNPITDNVRGDTGEDQKPADSPETLSLMEQYCQRWKHVEENLWMYTMKPSTNEAEDNIVGNTVDMANAQDTQFSGDGIIKLDTGIYLLQVHTNSELVNGEALWFDPLEAEVSAGSVSTAIEGSISTQKRECAGSVESYLGTDTQAIISVGCAEAESISGTPVTEIEGSISTEKHERAGSVESFLGQDAEAILTVGVLNTNTRENVIQTKIVDDTSIVDEPSYSTTFNGCEQAVQEPVKTGAATIVLITLMESAVTPTQRQRPDSQVSFPVNVLGCRKFTPTQV